MSMVFIAGLVGTGSNGTIQFNNIPQTFTHLQLRCFIRGDDPGAITSAAFDFINGTQTYSQHELQGTGTGVTSFGSTSIGIINFPTMPGVTATANVFGNVIVDILDYASTAKNKTIRQIGGYDANGSGYIGLKSAAQYDAATPITQIRLRPYSAANFVTGTRFDLYGISTSSITGA